MAPMEISGPLPPGLLLEASIGFCFLYGCSDGVEGEGIGDESMGRGPSAFDGDWIFS